MNIKRAKQEIVDTISAYLEKDEYGQSRIPGIRQRPVLLMGPPGIGKTQIMEQIARQCDIALVAYTITHHTRQSAVGLPFISSKSYGGKEERVTEYTMSEIIASVYDRMEVSGKREGILFIDEINCVSETLAPTMLQFLQCKTFGNRPVPEGWVIVAAGNPPEYNKSVREFDVVTLDRVKLINVEPDYDVWKEYAYQNGIHAAVIGYIDAHRNNFFRCETTVDGKRFVTARGWEDLSELIWSYERMGKTLDAEVAGQYLQYPAIARDFANYLELFYRYRKDYGVSSILAGQVPDQVLSRIRYAPFDERLQIISLILSALAGSFQAVRQKDICTGHLYDFLTQLRELKPENEEEAKQVSSAGRMGSADAPSAEAENAEKAVPAPVCAETFEHMLAEWKERIRLRAEAGQNEKQLLQEYRPVFRTLDRWLVDVKSAGIHPDSGETLPGGNCAKGSTWELLKEAFGRERDALASSMQETGDLLEHAFDFMELCFGESQEMVVFITELTCSPYAMWFIGEYECPRYDRYNKSLLFEDRQEMMVRRLDEIQAKMRGADDI